ncbi:MAG: amylo-alpha-1,6-glucosidase [Methylacidiphilales bacterium]|nr:amylo-alpha-1,6-glucosidase [Candidatus Methylacidiphilales bacterium]
MNPPFKVAPIACPPELATRILNDATLSRTRDLARKLLATGLNAGSGYSEIWIRDFATFIELALEVTEAAAIRKALLVFFNFQGEDGNIVDGYVPEINRSVCPYKYRKSAAQPGLLAHKNTVETDQESSLVQAIYIYVRATGDESILDLKVAGVTVVERLRRAMDYLNQERLSPEHGLLWGGNTVDWGDMQIGRAWGTELQPDDTRAISIYNNAMWVMALHQLGELQPAEAIKWREWEQRARDNIRLHLWDAERQKFRPHIHLDGYPFPPDFDEAPIWYHGGTAVAAQAGLLTVEELSNSLAAMRRNVRESGMPTLGITSYPIYPEHLTVADGLKAYAYQNGGDWPWLGGRMVQALADHGLVAEAYEVLLPMAERSVRDGDFNEWYNRENQGAGSWQFRGAAGVLATAIDRLRAAALGVVS